MRLMALVFAVWLALSIAARTMVGNACSRFAGDAWDACASGILHRLGLEDLFMPWVAAGILLLGGLLVGFIRWLRSPERITIPV